MSATAHSFTALLDRFGQFHPPTMRYEPGEDFAAWQARFRQQVSELRSPLPERPASTWPGWPA